MFKFLSVNVLSLLFVSCALSKRIPVNQHETSNVKYKNFLEDVGYGTTPYNYGYGQQFPFQAQPLPYAYSSYLPQYNPVSTYSNSYYPHSIPPQSQNMYYQNPNIPNLYQTSSNNQQGFPQFLQNGPMSIPNYFSPQPSFYPVFNYQNTPHSFPQNSFYPPFSNYQFPQNIPTSVIDVPTAPKQNSTSSMQYNSNPYQYWPDFNNIKTEIIDVPVRDNNQEITGKDSSNLPFIHLGNGMNNQPLPPDAMYFLNSLQSSQYKNIPTEIIDVPSPQQEQHAHKRENVRENEAYYKPQVTFNSKSNYTASVPKVISSSLVQSKPVDTIITRSFLPGNNDPVVQVTYINGERVTEKPTTTTEQPTTTEVITTTENPDSNPPSINNWFS